MADLSGTNNSDTIQGTASADTIRGLDGDDTIYATTGGDVIDGGTGTDVLDLMTALNAQLGHDVAVNAEIDGAVTSAGGEILVTDMASIEALRGGGCNDTLSGNQNDDALDGGGGDDQLSGRDGDDVLVGGSGNDTLTGGAGTDVLTGGDGADLFVFGAGWGNDTIADYADASDQIDMSGTGLAFSDLTITQDGSDALIADGSGNSIRLVNTTAADITADKLNLDSGIIEGTSGNDTLAGTAGTDTITGLGGDDTIYATTGNDIIDGGDGTDLLDLMTVLRDQLGRDYAVNAEIDGPVTAEGQLIISDMAHIEALKGGACNDTLWGNQNNDALDGSDGDDQLYGRAGNDTLVGGNGDDTLDGDIRHVPSETGDDRLTGGAGADTFSYQVAGWGNDTITDFEVGTDRIDMSGRGFTFLDLTITQDGDDALIEDGSGNSIRLLNVTADDLTPADLNIDAGGIIGTADSDTLDGTANDDRILGRSGDDAVSGGAGNDEIDGDSGNDRLSGSAGNDTLRGGAGNDTLLGEDGTDSLQGGDGSDRLHSGSGNGDTLRGGNGDDTLQIHTSRVVASGDADNDVLYVSGINSTVSGGDGDDLVRVNVSGVVASGDAGSDTLRAYAENVTLSGGDGDDSLLAGASQTTLLGGAGDDYIRIDATAMVNAGAGADTIYVTASGSNIDLGEDTDGDIVGVQSWDNLYRLNNTVFENWTTHDHLSVPLNGQDDYSVTSSVVDGNMQVTVKVFYHDVTFTVNGLTTGGFVGAAFGDTFVIYYSETGEVSESNAFGGLDIIGADSGETLSGTAGNDRISGREGHDSIVGGDGDDSLSGYWGNDTLEGGLGDDYLIGEGSNDRLVGGDGNDTLKGGAAQDTLLGGEGADVLVGGQGRDLLDGGNGDDTLTSDQYDTGDDTLLGGAGNDVLLGGRDSQVIEGGTGNDKLSGGSDDDTLRGGDGNDTLDDQGSPYYYYSGGNLLEGGAGNDKLTTSSSGRDTLSGGDGDDSISSGAMLLMGGDGNDTIRAQTASSAFKMTIEGGAGEDLIYLASSDAFVDLGEDDVTDTIRLGYTELTSRLDGTEFENWTEADRIVFDLSGLNYEPDYSGIQTQALGDDLIVMFTFGRGDADPLQGSIRINGAVGSRIVLAEAGNELTFKLVASDTTQADNTEGGADFFGSANNDIFDGTGNADRLSGEGGDDILRGNGGNDTISGGAGNDSAVGGNGDDFIRGGDGDDIVAGNAGDDLLEGSGGQDSLSGGDGNDTMVGGDGEDTLLGGSGDDLLLAHETTSSQATINDRIEGGDGNDTIRSEGGDDTLLGGAGDDVILDDDWNQGRTLLSGGDGNDTLTANGGDDTLDGGAGDDLLRGGSGNDLQLGGEGSDTITVGTGDDTVDLGADNDADVVRTGLSSYDVQNLDGTVIRNFTTADSIQVSTSYYEIGPSSEVVDGNTVVTLDFRGSSYQFTLEGFEGELVHLPPHATSGGTHTFLFAPVGGGCQDNEAGGFTVFGTANGDSLGGGANADLLAGLAGDDTLRSGDGQDTLLGGAGDDLLYVSGSPGHIDGGDGQDTVSFADFDEALDVSISGGLQLSIDDLRINHIEAVIATDLADKIIVNDNVTVFGGAGDDTLSNSYYSGVLDGGDGADLISGASGTDALYGGNGDDTITSSASSYGTGDTIDGGSGNDLITIAGNGKAVISGGDGDDTVSVNKGAHVTGGAGNDLIISAGDDTRFYFGSGWGSDTIEGFDAGSERLSLATTGLSFADLTITAQGDDALVSDGSGNSILLTGVDASALTAEDFIFTNVHTGTSGNDYLLGSYLDDIISGGNGDDTIVGQDGDNTLTGGMGADVFVLSSPFGTNSITDFVVGQDRINIAGTSLGYSELTIVQEGENTVITGDGSLAITLEGVEATELGASSFVTADYLTTVWDFSAWLAYPTLIYNPTGSSSTDPLVVSGTHTISADDEVYVELGSYARGVISSGDTGTSLNNEGNIFVSHGKLHTYNSAVGVAGDGWDTLTNSGSISAVSYYSDAYGVSVQGRATAASTGLTNSGTIQALSRTESATGVYYNAAGETGSHTNSGTIHAWTGTGGLASAMRLYGDNTLANSGTLLAEGGSLSFGVGIYSGETSLTNTGIITASRHYEYGTSYGVYSSGNQASLVTITNDGTITADIGVRAYLATVNLTNTGTITGDIVLGIGDDTVTNTGTIGGTISASAGDDIILAGDGNDTVSGGVGSDTLDGGAGYDIATYADSDTAVAVDLSAGTATSGSGDNDVLSGFEAIVGSTYVDTLKGDSGDNQLSGGQGGARDFLTGGAGDDTLSGGNGDDVFVYAAGWGNDVITDFNVDGDLLEVSGTGLTFADLIITADGDDTVISDGSGNSIRLVGVASTDVTEAIFSFDGVIPFTNGDNADSIQEALGITDPWAEMPSGYAQPGSDPYTSSLYISGNRTVGADEDINIEVPNYSRAIRGYSGDSLTNEGQIWLELGYSYYSSNGIYNIGQFNNSGSTVIIGHNASLYGVRAYNIDNSGSIVAAGNSNVTTVYFTNNGGILTNTGHIEAWADGGYATGVELEWQRGFTNDGTILAQGSVGARGVRFDGRYVTDFVNNGTITAVSGDVDNGSVGVTFTTIQNGHKVTNTGTIEADISIQFLGNTYYDPTIINSGSLIGDLDLDNGGIFVIENTGSIEGDILLGDGDDRVDSTSGQIVGAISAGGGDDTIIGSESDDIILGGEGLDYLDGGNGDDTLTGGTGRDIFVITGNDVITDFGTGHDRLIFSDANFDDLTISSCGDDVIVSDGSGNQVTLVGHDSADITEDDFVVPGSLGDYLGILAPWTSLPDILVRPSGSSTHDGGLISDDIESEIYNPGTNESRFLTLNSHVANDSLIWVEYDEPYRDHSTIYIDPYLRLTNNGTIVAIDEDGWNTAVQGNYRSKVENHGNIYSIAGYDATGVSLRSGQLINHGTIESWAGESSSTGVELLYGDGTSQNHGTITANGFVLATAVYLHSVNSDGVTFENTGELFARTSSAGSDSIGIHNYSSYRSIIINSGVIDADIAYLGATWSSYETFNNDGTIIGDVKMQSGTDIFNNTGSITGDVDMGVGDDTLTNTGTITGNVDLSSGNDRLNNTGGSVDGIIDGGAGHDIIIGSAGDDTIDGGDGSDSLLGGDGNDSLAGGNGDDTIIGGNGDDMITLGSGGDVIDLRAGWGNDTVTDFNPDVDRIDIARLGIKYDDLTITSSGDDVIISDGEGNSLTLQNVALEDIGRDQFYIYTVNVGTDYADSFNSDADGQWQTDSYGNLVHGFAGDDSILGLGGDDYLVGGPGEDTLDGGEGSDWVSAADSYLGVSINLAEGTVTGEGNNGDTLISIENAVGSFAGDRLEGDSGDNILRGLSGGDVFAFDTGWGNDTIEDFDPTADILDFTDTGLTFADLVIAQDGDNTLISGGGNTLTLEDVTATDVVEAVFSFDGTATPTDDSPTGVIADVLGITDPWADLPEIGYLPFWSNIASSSFRPNITDGAIETGTYVNLNGSRLISVGSPQIETLTFDGAAIVRALTGYYSADAVVAHAETFVNQGLILAIAQNQEEAYGFLSVSGTALDNQGEIYAIAETYNAKAATIYINDPSDASVNSGHIEAWAGLHAMGVQVWGGSFNNIGTVLAQGAASGVGIRAESSSDTSITNSGQITAIDNTETINSVGVDLRGSGDHSFTNTGTVTAEIAVNASGYRYTDNGFTVNNSGTLDGAIHASNTWMDITNTGTITGDLNLGDGSDTIDSTGGQIHGVITAGEGDDLVRGSESDDTIEGGEGDDTLGGGHGEDLMSGGAGDDIFVLTPDWGNDTVEDFTLGHDLIGLSEGGVQFDDLIITQDGDNTVISDGSGNSLTLLNVTAETIDETAFLKGGIMVGTDADETLTDGDGSTKIYAARGDDTVAGQDGDDTIVGGLGHDRIDGGSGIDTASYEGSHKGVSIDLSSSGRQSSGDATGDRLINIENVIGSSNNDTLVGDGGDNILRGGDKRDALTGAGGDDTLIGGTGDDVFHFASGWGNDVIRDFSRGSNIIEMSGTGLAFSDLVITQSGDDAVISDGSGNSITLRDVAATDLTEADFSFDGTIPATDEDQGSGVYAYEILDLGVPFTFFPDHITRPDVDAQTGAQIYSGNTVIPTEEALYFKGTYRPIQVDGNFSNLGTIWTEGSTTGIYATPGDTVINGGRIVALAQTGYLRAIDIYDSATVVNNGEIYAVSAEGSAVGYETTSSSGNAINSGLVHAWAGGGDATGVNFQSGGNFFNSGTILTEGSVNATGILATHNTPVHIYNDGTITTNTGPNGNESIGVRFTRLVEGHSLTNTGTISADIAVQFDTTPQYYDPTITNSGTIEGDLRLLGGTFVVNNTGSITGDVTLAAGDDMFDSRDGSFTGRIYANAGDDTILLSDGAHFISAGSGDDVISAGAGDDTIYALDGNDLIDSGEGDDLINLGWGGRDTLVLSSGNDTVDGLTTADVIRTSDILDYSLNLTGNNVLLSYGGDQAGTLLFNNTSISMVEQAISRGTTGVRRIGNSRDEEIVGTVSDDTLYGQGGNDSLIGGAGADLLDGGHQHDRIDGGSGDDQIDGGTGDDTIDGGAGNDRINTGSGADVASGGNGDDTITSGSDNSTLSGDAGSDVITGGSGSDLILGGNGDDTLVTGGGADTLDGGQGDDLARFTDQSQAISLDLETGTVATATGTVTLRGIEKIVGSGSDDTLTGSSRDDTIVGSGGDDIIEGAGGNDLLTGSSGSDRFVFRGTSWGNDTIEDFTSGVDVIDMSSTLSTSSDVTFTKVGNGTLLEDGNGNSLLIRGIVPDDISLDDFLFTRIINGSSGNDSLGGDSQDNEMWGGCGDDMMDGGAGADSMVGGTGDDTINGGTGDDTIEGGAGADMMIGGAGADLVMGGCGDDTVQAIFIEPDAGAMTMRLEAMAEGGRASADIVLDDSIDAPQVTVSADGLTYTYEGGRNREGLALTEGQDSGQHYWEVTLTDVAREGGHLYVAIAAPADSDWTQDLATIDGSLMLRGIGRTYVGDGSRSRSGQNGLDRIREGDVIGVAFDADAGAIWISVNGEWQNGATAAEIAAGDTSHAVMTGIDVPYVPTAGGYSSYSRAGHTATFAFDEDSFSFSAPEGYSGYGGGANVVGDAGDTLDGGDGIDWIDLSNAPEGIIMGDSRLEAEGDSTIAGDIYRNFENIRGSAYADQLNGGDGDNVILGEDGNDTLSGGNGDDTITGGDGDDVILGVDAGDVIDGGDGYDVISYAHLSEGQSIVVSSNHQNIEAYEGSAGNDTITGSNGDDIIGGGDGDDIISGGEGDDTLSGGDGFDTLSGSNCADVIDLGTGTTSGGTGSDLITGFEAIAAGNGNDTIIGDDSANHLMGEGGDDRLIGGCGDDTLAGGAGADTFVFEADFVRDLVTDFTSGDDVIDLSRMPVTFSSLVITQNGSDAIVEVPDHGEITLAGVTAGDLTAADFYFGETSLEGTAGDDLIEGLFRDETLDGLAGDDTLMGGEGLDLLLGGAGNDVLDGGAGADIIMGGCGDDTVQAFAGASGSDKALEDATHASQVTVADGGLIYTYEGGRNREGVALDEDIDSGQYYWEVTLTDVAREGGHLYVAIAAPADSDWTQDLATIDGSLMLRGIGRTYVGDGSRSRSGQNGLDRIREGDVIGVAFDADAGAIWISVNGEWQNGATAAEIAAGDTSHAVMTGIDVPYVPTAGGYSSYSRAGHTATFNVNEDDFSFAAPEGFDPYGNAGAPEGGNDTVDGGDGIDVIDFAGLSAGIDMTGVTLSDTGGALIGGDLYRNFEGVTGSCHDDLLNGGDGNNNLSGGCGDDTLTGGAGDDTLTGGAGADFFRLTAGFGTAVITDFTQGTDRIDLRGSGYDYWDIVDGIGESGGIATFDDGNGNVLTFAGIAAGAISVDDFLFGGSIILGTNGADTVTGTTEADYMIGLDSDDSLFGGAGDDTLLGSNGDDTLNGGDGFDHINLTDSNDVVNLGTGVAEMG
ncbi:M10 family metallopeptidase C-terminal domain-containing protein, partial [Kordiimonas sp. UBA4487]